MPKHVRYGVVIASVLLLTSCSQFMRHVAEYRFGPEQFTTAAALPLGGGGMPIYTKTFNLPSDQHTVFITLSTTGDTHGGAASWFTASVNGTVCNRGNEGAGFAPTGWIPLQKHRDSTAGGDGGGGIGDLHDNSIYYTWCCIDGVKPGGPNTAEIKMASSHPNDFTKTVFIERSHFYVDSCKPRLCTPAGPPGGPGTAAEALDAQQELPPGHQHPQKPPL